MAYIHIKCIILIISLQKVANVPCPKLRSHLFNCMALVGLIWISEYKAEGYDSGYFQPGTDKLMDTAIRSLLKKIRP